MNLFQILEVDLCADGSLIATLVAVVKTIFTIIQFGVPAVLIILCAVDMFKAMTSGDEKATKEIQKKVVRRLVYALVIFLIIPLITLILNTVNSVVDVDGTQDAVSTFEAFMHCWNKGSSGSSSGSSGGSSSSGQCFDNNSYESALGKEACKAAGYQWVE